MHTLHSTLAVLLVALLTLVADPDKQSLRQLSFVPVLPQLALPLVRAEQIPYSGQIIDYRWLSFRQYISWCDVL